jgi:hypothetical protein
MEPGDGGDSDDDDDGEADPRERVAVVCRRLGGACDPTEGIAKFREKVL